MESLKWLLGYAQEPSNILEYESDTSDLSDEEPVDVAALFAKDVPSDEIGSNWCVLVEDTRSIKTVEITDVHTQRVRNRPKLANWVTEEDYLIENPLQLPGETPPSAHTAWTHKAPGSYAEAARPSYAQMLARKEQSLVIYDDGTDSSRGVRRSTARKSSECYEDEEFDVEDVPVWTQVTGMVSNYAAHRVDGLCTSRKHSKRTGHSQKKKA